MSRPFVRVLGVALAAACNTPVHPGATAPEPAPPSPAAPAEPVPEAPEPMPAVAAGAQTVPEAGTEAGSAPGTVGGLPTIPRNPPPPLPTWDEVISPHPEGATNPPSPVLIVRREDRSCHKGWWGGMVPPPPAVLQARGRVAETAAEVGFATRVVCPPGEPDRLLAAWDALPADVRAATRPVPGSSR